MRPQQPYRQPPMKQSSSSLSSINSRFSHHQSQASSRSILSDQVIKKRTREEIRPSTVRADDKLVMLWTEVVTPPVYPDLIEAEKLQYNSGSLLHEW